MQKSFVSIELEVHNLWHEFKSNKNNNWVLKDINFTLKAGELIGLLGPSGCGKTTLLRLIAGFEKPKRGLIKKNGQIISNNHYLRGPLLFGAIALKVPRLRASWGERC